MSSGNPLNSLKISKRIADPIHGLIKLNEIESKVLEHPAFQRLRGITQLGIANYVYPGATHNRFSHSLGTLHNVTEMYDAAYRNWKRYPDLCGDIEGDWLFSEELFQATRLAALCHDLGHFPFSHNLEEALDWLADIKLISTTYRHEKLSAIIIEQILGSLLDKYVPLITGLIQNDYAKTRNSLFANFLISSSVDADRMDYLVRDSLHCGVDHGRIDKDRLLDSVLPYSIDFNGNKQDVLAFHSKGIEALEQFLLARHRMHQTIYFNPSVIGFEAALLRAYYRITTDNPPWDMPDVYLDDPQRFLDFDEASLMVQMKKELQKRNSWLFQPVIKRKPLAKYGPFYITLVKGRETKSEERERFRLLKEMHLLLENPSECWNKKDYWSFSESKEQSLLDPLPRSIITGGDVFEDSKNLKNVIFLLSGNGKLIDPTSIDYGHTFLPFISGYNYYRFLFFCQKKDSSRMYKELHPLIDKFDEFQSRKPNLPDL